MANQIVVSAGAKVRNLSGVLTATSGVVSFLPIDVSLGIPQLDVNGKILVSQLPNSVMEYKGTWDASTNTPTLANGTGNQGDVYLCNVAGTTNFGAGPIAFFVGDQVIYSGSIWQRASGATGTVTSVAVTESGDSLNITGSPITTSGTINIGFNGTNLQYVNGAGNLTTFPILTGYVPYTGATGAVNLGAYDLTVQGLTIGKGASALANNTALGYRALFHITTGNYNTAVGYESSHNITTGQYNTTLGQSALFTNTTGSQNTAIGLNALLYNLTGGSNVAVGLDAMQHNTSGSSNLALGYNAGSHITGGTTPNTTASSSVYIGRDTRANVDGGTNEIVIGNTVTGNGSNTVTIGNSSITANYFKGSINADSFVKSGGTSIQFLKADGTVDSNTYALDSAVVHNTGNETIGGTKTFSDATKNNGGIFLQNASSSSLAGYMNIGGLTNGVKFTSGGGVSNSFTLPSATGYTFTFPNANGTLALTSDISYPVTSVFGRTGAVVATEGDYSLTQLSDVTITSPTTNQVLKYNGTAWINDTDANTGTVTSVGLSSATSGVTIGSTPITTSGTITIAIATATTSQNGLLSSADWTTFNNKQATITLTTTGTSGAATFSANTLNIPDYGSALSGYLPLTGGTLTGALGGTSATFSSSVTATGTINAIGTSPLFRNTDNSVGNVFDVLWSVGGSFWAYGVAGFYDATNSQKYDEYKGGASGFRKLYTNGVIRQTIDANGNVGIGTSSPTAKLMVLSDTNTSSTNIGRFAANNNTLAIGIGYETIRQTETGGIIAFETNATERMRITSGGALCLGVTSAYGTNLLNVNGGIYATSSIAAVVAADIDMLAFVNTGATYSKACVVASMTATGGTGSYFFYGQQSTSTVALKIFSNGNIQNTNNSYGAISDARLKENIIDATPKLDDLMKVKVRNYNLKGESNKQLGVISQELEAIFPNMIEESTNIGSDVKIKGVKYSVFVPMLIKAVQELKAEIEILKNK